MNENLSAIALLLSDSRGIYIPRDFINAFDLTKWDGLDNVNLKDLTDPQNEFYWETWQLVLDYAEHVKDGNTWRLHQDGDLWALCYELMTEEEKENFGFEND